MRLLSLIFCLLLSGVTAAETNKETGKSVSEFINQSAKFKEKTKNVQKKPELADFANYNDFLQAMYAFQKNEEQGYKPD
ncbi:MAG: hypothetical protein KDI39_16200, partial [Pseudomonadales bacterium]|nr:hypothetical protein [Pseudomonadales bacterium]